MVSILCLVGKENMLNGTGDNPPEPARIPTLLKQQQIGRHMK